MTASLTLTDATVKLGSAVVLNAASLAVQPGEVVGVVGANGAGKTTLLRAALGLAKLEPGRAELAGRDVATLSDAERAALAAYLPQERRVGWNLPAWRVASLGAFERPPKEARAIALRALARVGLLDLQDRGVLDMSGERDHLTCALLSAERLFRRRGRNWRHATGWFIAALCAVPDRTPSRLDRRHCGREPAGRRRVTAKPSVLRG